MAASAVASAAASATNPASEWTRHSAIDSR